MNEYYKDKVAAVTGAASGIGLGIAAGLLRRGALAVFMADNNEENLIRKSATLNEQFGARTFPLPTDVTDQKQVEALVVRPRRTTIIWILSSTTRASA